ncbi:MAG: peptidyl-prolyl cis-trans isomerase [Lentisphaeria bacterium]|nr:peptidyl-prolyl cis-trans isomerase [Lentisphaeria bacterium]
MKKLPLIVFFTAAFRLFSAPVLPLPDVIARVDGQAIPSSEKMKGAWAKALFALPDDVSQETIDRLFRTFVDEIIWQREIVLLLEGAGFPPDREAAEKYLAAWRKVLPDPEAWKKYAPSPEAPDTRLKGALHFYLEKTVPGKLAVSREEAEACYRNNPQLFRVRGRTILGIMEIADREKAEEAHALLLQGSSFDAVAQKYASSGNAEPTEELLALTAKMKVRETTPLLRSPGGWMIAQVRTRTQDSFIPFEKVLPLIRLQLSTKKEGPALAEILKARLAGKKITYAPPPRPK